MTNTEKIVALDKKQSAFFSHTDPNMVEWFWKKSTMALWRDWNVI